MLVGALGALGWIIELIGRNATTDDAYGLWPRNDGSDEARGTVWDHGA